MKNLSFVLLTLTSFSAFGTQQTIRCSGVEAKASLTAKLVFTSHGVSRPKSEITLRGIWEEGSMFGEGFTNISADQSKVNAENQWTTIYFNDEANGELVEYQLQFNERVLKRNFTDVRATLAIGVENNSSEAMPGFGFDLLCSSRIK